MIQELTVLLLAWAHEILPASGEKNDSHIMANMPYIVDMCIADSKYIV